MWIVEEFIHSRFLPLIVTGDGNEELAEVKGLIIRTSPDIYVLLMDLADSSMSQLSVSALGTIRNLLMQDVSLFLRNGDFMNKLINLALISKEEAIWSQAARCLCQIVRSSNDNRTLLFSFKKLLQAILRLLAESKFFILQNEAVLALTLLLLLRIEEPNTTVLGEDEKDLLTRFALEESLMERLKKLVLEPGQKLEMQQNCFTFLLVLTRRLCKEAQELVSDFKLRLALLNDLGEEEWRENINALLT